MALVSRVLSLMKVSAGEALEHNHPPLTLFTRRGVECLSYFYAQRGNVPPSPVIKIFSREY